MPRPIGRSTPSAVSTTQAAQLRELKASIKQQFTAALAGGIGESSKWATKKPAGRGFEEVALGRRGDFRYIAMVKPGAQSFVVRREAAGSAPQFLGPVEVKKRGGQTLPFFAKFLENQNGGRVGGGRRPGGNLGTEKFPSDQEDTGGGVGGGRRPGGNLGTEKFPSDQEDTGGGVGGGRRPGGNLGTEKFPSDQEDTGGGVGGGRRPGGNLGTEKFPSDQEDTGGGGGRPGGNLGTEKFPSDSDE